MKGGSTSRRALAWVVLPLAIGCSASARSPAPTPIPPAPPLASVVSVDSATRAVIVRMAFMSTYSYADHVPAQAFAQLRAGGRTTAVELDLIGEPVALPAGGWALGNYRLPVPDGVAGSAVLLLRGDEGGYAFVLPPR